jgi:hypothetical protein
VLTLSRHLQARISIQIYDHFHYAVIDAQMSNGIANDRQLIYTAIDAK